jgi:hypothetical protein
MSTFLAEGSHPRRTMRRLFLVNHSKPDQEPHTEPEEATESFSFTLLTKTRL